MVMTTPNDQFAQQLVDALEIVDEGDRVNAVLLAINGWNGGGFLSNAELALEISQNQTLQRTRDSDISNWALGDPTAVITDPAGQPAPGWYPIRITRSGALVWEPCIELLKTNLAKGDPAKTGWVSTCYTKPAPNVVMDGFSSPGNMSFTNAKCTGYCRVPATNAAVFTLKKGGAAVGTATFAPGATKPTYAFTGGVCNLVFENIFEVVTPSAQDPTLAGISFTFAGD